MRKLLATVLMAAGLVLVAPGAAYADCDYGSDNGGGGTTIGTYPAPGGHRNAARAIMPSAEGRQLCRGCHHVDAQSSGPLHRGGGCTALPLPPPMNAPTSRRSRCPEHGPPRTNVSTST